MKFLAPLSFALSAALLMGVGVEAAVNRTPVPITKPATGFVDSFADAAPSSTGFVATWTRRNTAGTGNSVRLRAYTSSGKPAKAEVVVASGPNTLGGLSRILPIGSGKFVVVWRDMTQLYGAIYTLSTNKMGPKKSLVPSNEQLTDLALLPNGTIGLVTSAYKGPGSLDYFVTVSVLSRTLSVLSGPTPVHTPPYFGFNTVGLDYAIAPTASGGVVLRYDRVDGQLYAQRFGTSGALAGAQVKVNKTDNQSADLFNRVYRTVKAVRLTDGRIFVAWASLEGNAYIDGWEIRGRYLDANGRPTGAEIKLNAASEGKQTLPELAALPGGRVLVGYASEKPPAQATLFRIVSATGKPGTVRTLDTIDDGAIGLDSDFSLLADGTVVNVLSGPASVMAEGIPAAQLK